MKSKKITGIILITTMLVSFFTGLAVNKNVKAADGAAQAQKHVINIVWDGISSDLFNRLKAAGMETPNIDALIESGTKLDNVATTIPSYGAAQAALITGAYPGTNGFLYRYYDSDTKTVISDVKSTCKVDGQTVFEDINSKKPGLNTLAIGMNISGLQGSSINGRGVSKDDEKHKLIEYALGDNLVPFSTVSVDINNAINGPPDSMPDYILAYSNDMKMLYWNGGDLTKFDQNAKDTIMALDTKLGEVITALKNKNIYDNTIIILNSLSSIYAVKNKIPGSFATTITNDTATKVDFSNPAKAVADDVKAVIVKTYIMKYGQLYFTSNASDDDKKKVINYLNDKTSNIGKYIKGILNPSDFNAPGVFADYFIDPVSDYTFSQATSGYGRTDNLDDMNQLCIVSGAGVKKGASIGNGGIVDIAPNICSMLGIDPPANNEGKIWGIYDFVKPQLNVVIDGQKDAQGNYKSEINVSIDASDNNSNLKIQYDMGSGYTAYSGPFKINGDCTLKVRAIDCAGNITEQTYPLNFVRLIDQVNVACDTDISGGRIFTDSDTAVISGDIIVNDPNIEIRINNEKLDDNSKSFTKEVKLKDGKNDIEIKASLNELSNIVNKTVYKVYNPNITSVSDGAVVSNPKQDIKGNVVPGSSVKVNNSAVIVNEDGSFTAQVNLIEGENDITVASAAGKYSKDTNFKVYYYNSPVITIDSPRDLQVVNTSSIKVTGSVNRNCTVTVNGSQVVLDTDNKFTADVNLKNGINIIKVDANNNGVTAAKTIKIDYVAPDEGYVVYINWDGFARYYYDLANKGGTSRTPLINQLIKSGVFFENVYTGIPSITNAMQTAIVSGAWPVTTGNAYRYYDKEKKAVIQFARENDAENIAEAAVRQGLKVASVNQFILENRGTVAGNPDMPYITASGINDYAARFDEVIKLIKGEAAGQGKGKVQLDEIPRFLALYMDDLDGLGHNEEATYGVPTASTEEGRLNNVLNRLEKMDAKLGEFIQACKDRGIYDNMSFVLTTDHGMAPFGRQGTEPDDYGYSKLPDLVSTIEGCGYKTEVLFGDQSPKQDTDIVIVCVGLQAQISFTKSYTHADIEKINNAVKDKNYIGYIMKKDEMDERGAIKDFADLIFSPKPPYSFKTKTDPTQPDKLYIGRGQHDSLDESAQHVFSMMWGSGVKQGYVYNGRISIIDFARTMAGLIGMETPRNATGNLLAAALTNNSDNNNNDDQGPVYNADDSDINKAVNDTKSILSDNTLSDEELRKNVRDKIVPQIQSHLTTPGVIFNVTSLSDGRTMETINGQGIDDAINFASKFIEKMQNTIKDEKQLNIIKDEIGKVNIPLHKGYSKNIGISADTISKLETNKLSLNLQYPGLDINIGSQVLNAGAAGGNMLVNVEPVTDAKVLNKIYVGQADGRIIGNGYSVSISSEKDGQTSRLTELNSSISLVFKLNEKDMEGVNPESLKVYKQDEQTGKLIELGGVYLPGQKAIQVSTDHLCNFIILSNISPVRLWGADRYKTATAVSMKGWPDKSDSVILANGANYNDLLAGILLSKIKNAPILYTGKDSINSDTYNEIKRLDAKSIYLLGGEETISKDIESTLKKKFNVERVYDEDHCITAVKLGNLLRGQKKSDTVILVNKDDFPDAVTAAPYASKELIPILFTSSDSLNESTKQAIVDWNIKKVIIIGGEGRIQSSVENKIKDDLKMDVKRVSGSDRYMTPLEAAKYFQTSIDCKEIIIASGEEFADAIAGTALASKDGCPILLSKPDDMDQRLLEYINSLKVQNIYILGGTGAITDNILKKIKTGNK